MLARYLFLFVAITAIVATAVPIGAEGVNEPVLEELAYQLVNDELVGSDMEILRGLNREQIYELNSLIEQLLVEDEIFFSVPFESDSIQFIYSSREPQWGEVGANGCETILNYKLSNYSYHLPYAYWYKKEAWGDDLMLDYAYWTSNGSMRLKAFYISDYWLYLAMRNCGVAVYWEKMEGKKQRVTADVGYSIWKPFGQDRVRYNTILGFRTY